LVNHPSYASEIHLFWRIKSLRLSVTNSDYLNIVTTATGNKETDWALQFIENYKNYLPEKDKEKVMALALATVQYDKGDFYKVTKLLSPFSFRKSPLGIRFRFITVKAYVELAFLDSDNLKLAQTYILRMQQYIKRGSKKRETDQSIGFSNFLKIVNTILKKSTNQNKPELEKIKLLIESKSPLIDKKWLLQKVEELEQP